MVLAGTKRSGDAPIAAPGCPSVNLGAQMSDYAAGMGPAELVQAINVSRQYYLENRSKIEIADALGISRYKVARILDAAVAAGVVKIEIGAPELYDAELSERLGKALRLQHCLVVDLREKNPSEEAVRSAIGTAAANLLGEIVSDEDTLGIAWGRSVSSMAMSLTTLAKCDVVQMTGVAGSLGSTSVDILQRVATVSGGQAFPIYAPLVVPSRETAESLKTLPAVADAMGQFSRITKATIAVGNWTTEGSQLYASLTPAEAKSLRADNVAAEVCAMLLDDAGRPMRSDFEGRTVAIDYEHLRAIPEVVAVAAGAAKARAILAVVRSGIATSLVTDAAAARAILRHSR
jgi:DNA-binding transcriptional regulator LsrR (DeoR family)